MYINIYFDTYTCEKVFETFPAIFNFISCVFSIIKNVTFTLIPVNQSENRKFATVNKITYTSEETLKAFPAIFYIIGGVLSIINCISLVSREEIVDFVTEVLSTINKVIKVTLYNFYSTTCY